MAASIFDARDCAGNSVSAFFTTLDPKSGGIVAPGLVQHWGVTFDVQVKVLAAVLETGSATMEDLVAVLPGHPAPADAIMAMVNAGVLARDESTVGPYTRITMPVSVAPAGGGAGGSNGGSGSKPDPTASDNVVTLRSSLAHAKARGFTPEIFTVDMADRTDLPAEITGPIIYVALSGRKAYVGKSGRGRSRVLGSRLAGFDRLLVLRDASGLMDERQIAICERIGALTIAGLRHYTLTQDLPAGEQGDYDEYVQLRRFVGQGFCLAKQAGFGFEDVSAADLMAGGRGDPNRLSPVEPRQLRGAEEYHLYAVGINATASALDGDWFVHAGSEVRARVTPSGSSVVTSLRHEWRFSGILVEEEGRFRLTEPVRFSSGTGAASFLIGSKGPNLAAWSRRGSMGPDRVPLPG
jgi:hypothetical protein